MRDELLKCIEGLAETLSDEIMHGKYLSPYEDIKLGKRFICSQCGITSEFSHPFKAPHQDWCRVGKAAKIILQANRYVPYHG